MAGTTLPASAAPGRRERPVERSHFSLADADSGIAFPGKRERLAMPANAVTDAQAGNASGCKPILNPPRPLCGMAELQRAIVAQCSGPPQTKNKQRKPGLRHRHGRRPAHDKCE